MFLSGFKGSVEDNTYPPMLSVINIRIDFKGDFGPFNPGMPVDVPVWLAVTLKQRNKCKIHAPAWLDVGMLFIFQFSAWYV